MLEMFDYFDEYMKLMHKPSRYKSRPTVLHQKTCPDCGRKLVNIYYSSQLERYTCKQCMDRIIGERKDHERTD